MKGEAYIYKADGKVEQRHYEATPSLEGLREAVGGPIEAVPYWHSFNGARCVAFCNEEGKLNKLPLNVKATALWLNYVPHMLGHDVLVGDVIILTGDSEFMEAL